MSTLLDDILRRREEAANQAASRTFKESQLDLATQIKSERLQSATDAKLREKELADRQRLVDTLNAANSDRSIGETVKDTALGLGAKGALAIGQTAYGLSDLISRFNPVTLVDATQNYINNGEFDAVNIPSLDELTEGEDGQALSQRFAETREILNENQSDKLNAQREIVQQRAQRRDAENALTRSEDDSLLDKTGQVLSDFGAAVGDQLDNPSAALDTTLESLPQMFVPGAIAKQFTKGAIKKQTKGAVDADDVAAKYIASKEGKATIEKIAERSGVAFTVAAEGVSNGIQVQGEILNASHDDLLASSPKYQELIDNGMSPEKAKRSLADDASLITTGLAGLFGGTASKFTGAGKLEGKLFKIDSPIGKSIVTKTAAGASKEGLEETIQEGAGQFSSNVGKKLTVDPDQDLGEGVVDSAAAGFVAGAGSGGAITGASNIGTGIDNAKENINKVKDAVVKKAGENTGQTETVREAIKTGDTSEVLATDKEGTPKRPLEAATYMLEKEAPTDVEELKQHKGKIAVMLSHAMNELAEGKLSAKEEKVLNAKIKETKQLGQQVTDQQKPVVDEFIKRVSEGDVKPSKQTTSDIANAKDLFGNTDLTSPAVAKEVAEKATKLLDSGLVSEADAAQLQNTINTAKSFDAATEEIFNGRGTQFTGINTHKQSITSAVQAGDQKLAQKSLGALTRFRDTHTTKLEQLEAAFAAHRKIKPGQSRSDLSESDQKAIEVAENRTGNGGRKFKVTNGTGTLIKSIRSEVSALNNATTEMEGIVGNVSANTESDINTPVDTPEASESVSGPVSTEGTGAELLARATELGLNVKPGYRNNPNHRKSVSALKAKLTAYNNSLSAGVVEEAKAPAAATENKSQPLRSAQGIKNKVAKETSSLDSNTKEGRQEYVTKRNDVYAKEYNKLADKAKAAGVQLNPKTVDKIKNRNFRNVAYVESAIAELEKTIKKVESNKELAKEHTELVAKAETLGIKTFDGDIEIVAEQNQENINIIPKIVKDLRDKVNAADKNYDVRKQLFSESTEELAHVNENKGVTVNKGSKTPLTDNFTWDKDAPKNILHDTPNAFNEVRELLEDTSLTGDQRTAVESIVKFHDEFKETFLSNFKSKDNRFLYQDGINYLLKQGYDKNNITEADIDPNVVTAMAMVSMNWLGTKGSKTLINRKEDINAMLQRDTKAVPTNFENEVLQYRGTNYNVAVRQDIGPEVMRSLGIRPKNTTPGNVTQGLSNSLTNHAMGALMQMDLVTQTNVPSFAIAAMIEGKGQDEIQSLATKKKNKFETTPFIRINGEFEKKHGVDVAVPAKNVAPYIDAVRNSEKLLETMFALKSNETKPIFEKPKETPDAVTEDIRNSSQKVPRKVQEKLAKEQQYEYGLNAKAVDLLNYLGEKSTLEIEGFDTDYLKTKHISEHKNVEGKNSTIYRDYENFQNFLNSMPSDDAGFYFPKQVWKSMRMGFDSNTVNPQASHFHRNMVAIKSHVTEIDPNNQEHVDKFLRGVAASLGMKTEQMEVAEYKAKLVQKITEPVFAEGLAALQNRDGSDANKAAIVAAAKAGGEAHWSLTGLTAYADYLKAVETGEKFTSYLYREPDGITNGVAISLLQFVPENIQSTVDRLKRVGIFTKDGDTFNEWISNPNNNDAYQDIAKKWNQGINSIRNEIQGTDTVTDENIKKYMDDFNSSVSENKKLPVLDSLINLVGSFVEEDGNTISKLGRNLSKNPLMTNNYGAAIAKIIDTFSNDRLNNVYKNIAEAANNNDKSTVRGLISDLSNVIGTKIDVEKVLADPLNWELTRQQKEAFVFITTSIYGGTVESAIQSEYGDIIDKRKTINRAMHIAFNAFKIQYDKKHTELQNALDGRLPSKTQLKELNDSLLDAMPIFKGVFSAGKEDGIMVMKRTFTSNRESKFSRTQSNFNNKFDVGTLNLADPTGDLVASKQGSLTLYATQNDWADGGVAGPITAIHNVDASVMVSMLENHAAANIHDAAIFSVLDAEEGTQSLNKSFHEINRDHSVMNELFDSFVNSVKYLKENDFPGFKELDKMVIDQGMAGYAGKKAITLNAFAAQFNRENKQNTASRKELFDQIKYVNQYTDGPGTEFQVDNNTDTYSDKEMNKLLREATSHLRDEAKDDNDFGSTNESDFINDFRASQEREITNKTSKEIFDDLGNNDVIKDSPQHETRLRGLLDQIVNKAIKPTNLYIQEKGDTNLGALSDGSIYMSNALPNQAAAFGTNMSQRETYVHELMHAVTHAMIDGNTSAARQLRRFYLEIKNAKDSKGNQWLTAKDFLDPNIKPTDANYAQELAIAQDRYDYLFGKNVGKRTGRILNPVTEQFVETQLSNAHHEFLVMAVTNEAFIEKLSNYDKEVKTQEDSTDTWIGKFTTWVQNLLNKFVNKSLFAGDSQSSLDKKMVILAGQLAGIDSRNKSNLWIQAERASDFVGDVFNKTAELALTPIKKVVHSKRLANSKSKIVKTAVSAAKAAPYVEEVVEAIQTAKDATGITKQGFIMSILHELRGEHKNNTYLHDLSRMSVNFIDKVRLKAFNVISGFVRQSYLSELDDAKNQALSNLLRTDMDSLFDRTEGDVIYDGAYIEKLYTDEAFRRKEIEKLQLEIQKTFGKNKQSKWYITMATSMAHEMITGRPIQRFSIMNSKIIADMDNTNITPKGDIKLAERLIDRLATIQSIEYTDANTREIVGNVVRDEYGANKDVNGITTTLLLHRENKKFAKKTLFAGEDKLFIKGYTKEQFAQNKSFVVAPASHEAELLKQGYTKSRKVPKDVRDPNQEDAYMYLSNMNSFGKYLSGIVSITGKRAKGTNLTKIYSQMSELDPGVAASIDRPVITKRKLMEVQGILNGTAQPLKDDEGVLAPVFNRHGDITDFRYKMDEATKNKVLGKDNSLDTTLGSMESHIIDKNNSRVINNKVIKETHDYFKKHAKDGTKGYIEVSPNSPDEQYREVYRMLPEEFKQGIRDIWGGDSMYVKTEEATFIFGERELLLSNLEYKNPSDTTSSVEWLGAQLNNAAAYVLNRPSVKYVETIWKEVISMAKDAVVIKSGVVLLGNKISNTILLKTMGVSVKDIAKYHAEAFIGIRDHRKDTDELTQLELEVKTDASKAKVHAARIRELKHNISINPVTPLIDAGMFQHIVEDVDLFKEDSYQSRIAEWLDKNKVTKSITDNTPDVLKTVAKNVAMTHDTKAYKFMRDMTQASDFVARYTLHQHNMTKRKGEISPKESIDLITKVFVNYTPPTHRYLQYANDMGLFMFTKFFLRIQGVLLYLAKERPGSLLASIVGQGLTVDVSDISDSFLPAGLDTRMTNPLDVAEQIITSPASIAGIDEALD